MKSQSQRNESVFYYGACGGRWAWNDIQMNFNAPRKKLRSIHTNCFQCIQLCLIAQIRLMHTHTHARNNGHSTRVTASSSYHFHVHLPSICLTSLQWLKYRWPAAKSWQLISHRATTLKTRGYKLTVAFGGSASTCVHIYSAALYHNNYSMFSLDV